MREKVGKSRFTVFFQWFVAPEGRKVGSLKRRVRSQLARWEMKNCTPLWREAHFQVKMHKNTPGPDHFRQLRCRKSARRCGAKHISKSKCWKHRGFGPLLEVQISKKCTPLWREAHFEVNMLKALGVRTIFGGSDVASLHYTTLHYTTRHDTTLQYATLHYTPVHSTTLNDTTPHYITLHYVPLHYITLHYSTLHYTSLHYTTLSSTTLHYLTLHYTPLHYNYNYNYTPLHSTTLH